MAPPGRASSSQTGVEKWCGPHHWAICFGSIHALKTMERGASKTQVILTSRCGRGVEASFFAGMLFLLGLDLLEVVVEAIKTVFPEPAVVLDPVGDIFKRLGFQPAGSPLRPPAARDQAGALEDFQVLGDSGEGHVKGFGQLVDRSLS